MTPAQLTALTDVHRRVNDPKAARRGQARQGSAADLARLSGLGG